MAKLAPRGRGGRRPLGRELPAASVWLRRADEVGEELHEDVVCVVAVVHAVDGAVGSRLRDAERVEALDARRFERLVDDLGEGACRANETTRREKRDRARGLSFLFFCEGGEKFVFFFRRLRRGGSRAGPLARAVPASGSSAFFDDAFRRRRHPQTHTRSFAG